MSIETLAIGLGLISAIVLLFVSMGLLAAWYMATSILARKIGKYGWVLYLVPLGMLVLPFIISIPLILIYDMVIITIAMKMGRDCLKREEETNGNKDGYSGQESAYS